MLTDLLGLQEPDLWAWLIVGGLVARVFLNGMFR